MSGTIGPRQQARRGHSAVHTLIYLMQAAWLSIPGTTLYGYFSRTSLKDLIL